MNVVNVVNVVNIGEHVEKCDVHVYPIESKTLVNVVNVVPGFFTLRRTYVAKPDATLREDIASGKLRKAICQIEQQTLSSTRLSFDACGIHAPKATSICRGAKAGQSLNHIGNASWTREVRLRSY